MTEKVQVDSRLVEELKKQLGPEVFVQLTLSIVDAVGKDVTGFAAGDEVNLVPSFSMNQYFTYGEVILAPDYAVVKHPKSLSFTEAASIWMMFVTAYGALIEDAKVTKGDFVIVPAASSRD